ncbi:FHA domain-containing protein [Nocardiopsis metallicus]|uniref:2-polyprenyl-6-methoxyphenol hydroxylase-like FAD-dependent oxidoreductase n=1 Tax=Nocardiopsis metallicus TaxID=179819 RepID=A0A840W3V8_9ACTN|nr:FHA domain-containing protein [Nocardiopsis metallicus]MBB5490664.1 2-polyprenyl-6-methoxyphenol hydroxylase-like FAD-dependent oxidoreductase [Nocardiopsis metallicus]
MTFEIVGREGPRAGQRFLFGESPVTFGRHKKNSVVVASQLASRFHAEIVREGDDHVLRDRGSSNGTRVNGDEVHHRVLRPGDLMTIGDETFSWETAQVADTVADFPMTQMFVRPSVAKGPVLNVTVAGGGPVGLAFALLLEHLIGPQVAVTVHDGRWTREGSRVVWKDLKQGNVRRQQVVTVQSRQFLNLSEQIQERLFTPGSYTEMWPSGADSIRGYGPRNIRISHVEDVLLEMANESQRIRLVPGRFDAAQQQGALERSHVLAICDGSRSRTREHFADRFGRPDPSIYSLDGEQVEDIVLGLRVRSDLSDATTVLLTVAQNRFLLNSLRGEGFLNMRLTDEEAREVVGIDPVRQVFEQCIASRPCVMTRDGHGDFSCSTHSSLFLPALVKGSALWKRVREGLAFFGVAEENLSAVTAFRLSMVQQPRFSAQLRPATPSSPSTYGFLLGDAANAIHFWPGRGLNSGLASAISLARSLSSTWKGRPLRDADFTRHEAVMSMLQYRHKSRAWQAMVNTDQEGAAYTIKAGIARSMAAQDGDREADVKTLLERMGSIRSRLSARIAGMPDDADLRARLEGLDDTTLRSLVGGGQWDTLTVGGEEVDIDIFYQEEALSSSPAKEREAVGAAPARGNAP